MPLYELKIKVVQKERDIQRYVTCTLLFISPSNCLILLNDILLFFPLFFTQQLYLCRMWKVTIVTKKSVIIIDEDDELNLTCKIWACEEHRECENVCAINLNSSFFFLGQFGQWGTPILWLHIPLFSTAALKRKLFLILSLFLCLC